MVSWRGRGGGPNKGGGARVKVQLKGGDACYGPGVEKPDGRPGQEGREKKKETTRCQRGEDKKREKRLSLKTQKKNREREMTVFSKKKKKNPGVTRP